ncbi:MAG: hypothetical protein IJO45_06555, partial [Oscillospiraceae bacterium]|nr:hypothetical protein [Oscillospiraceae bacterium]
MGKFMVLLGAETEGGKIFGLASRRLGVQSKAFSLGRRWHAVGVTDVGRYGCALVPYTDANYIATPHQSKIKD